MARLFDDGASEYCYRDGAPATAAPLTMACWFYSDDITILQIPMYLGDKDQDNVHFFELQLAGNVAGDPVRASASDAGNSTAASSAGYSANTWHHACAVFAAADSRSAYIDGGNKGSNAVARTPAGIDRVAIGARADSAPGSYMSGRVAEPAIWNVALTDTEVASLAAGYSPLFIRPQNLVAYWSLIRDEDQDRVGGYDLTAVNAPSIASHVPIRYPFGAQIPSITAAAVVVAGKLVNSIRLKTLVHGSLTG